MLILAASAFILASMAAAQDPKTGDNPQADPQAAEIHRTSRDNRADMLHSLGLSEEQMQQIRKLHADQRPRMDEAQKRLRESTRSLNEAMYADEVSDSNVQNRLKDRQAALAEVERLRFTTEFAVRRILTPDQLVRFREMRQRFEKVREGIEMRRRERPFNRQRDINKTQHSESATPKDSQHTDL